MGEMEKSSLKTLKDLDKCPSCSCKYGKHIELDIVRQEAIKWIKEFREQHIGKHNEHLQLNQYSWMDFFNLTEEDLK